jgi:hypothetical protein
MMTVGRRSSFLFTASMLGVVLVVSASSPPARSGNVARSMAIATGYFDSIVVLARNARPIGPRGDQLTIELGYLERLRVGLGSPFRLVDEALHDPRLDSASRARTSRALLGRLHRGDAYVIDPTVLEGTGPWSSDGMGATGEAHLAFIDRAIRSAPDPRSGELAVRLAYSLAAAAGKISPANVSIAVQTAAMLRDRELALRDVRGLISEAAERQQDIMALLESRRALHAFAVEQPAITPLTDRMQIDAMISVPSLLRALDTLERVEPTMTSAATGTLLDAHFAQRLAELGRARPPLAQVAVTLRTRAHTTLRASNEESLAASMATADTTNPADERDDALAALAVAVALRSTAQSEPWFPGDDGPPVSDLMSQYGLAGVTFARNVPAGWRPYYTRELRDALRDLESVLPGLSVDGLRVRFGADALNDSALAMHDPKTRTLQLPIETSAGTVAHELAHDLDWQSARRLFASGGGYSTDRAMRERRGSLASSMLGLAEARVLSSSAPTLPPPPPSMGRPTELFARGVDWFVASALAQHGRSNGFLSVVEDATLTGYAAGAPAGLGLAGAQSLLAALGEMTYVPDSVRTRFESQWADATEIDPLLLVRRVLDAPIMLRGYGLPVGMRSDAARRSGLAWSTAEAVSPILSSTRPSVCVADESEEMLARRNLVLLAVEARAQGAAARRARYRPLVAVPDESERLRDAVRSAVIAELTTALANQGVVPLVPATFRSSAASCSSTAR